MLGKERWQLEPLNLRVGAEALNDSECRKRLFFDGPGRREAALRHNTTRIRLNCAPKSALKPYRDETQDAVIFIGASIIFDGIVCRIPEVARC